MQTIADRIDELIKANLALHVARTSHLSPQVERHRKDFIARQEQDVTRKKEELVQVLRIVLGQ